MPAPLPPRRLPKYRHYRPKNLAVVRLDGRDHYLGRYGSEESQERYRRLVAEWLARSTPPEPASAKSDDPGLTVSELILAYFRFAETYYRENGRPTREITNLKLALRPLRRLYGLTPARDFGPSALKAVRQAMIDAGLCRNEVNKRTRQVVRAFKWAVENELVPPSVHHGLKAVSGLRKGRSEARESEPVKPVPEALVEAVQPFVSGQVWAMIELQRLTGMRSGEAAIMKTCDLDTSGRVWVYSPSEHKTEHHGKRREVFLGPRAQEVLRPWLRTDLGAYLFSPREAMEEHLAERRRARKTPPPRSGKAPSRRGRRSRPLGERYTTSSYAHAIAAACRRAFPHPELSRIKRKDLDNDQLAELKRWRREHHWHPHQLRHNAATWLRKEFGLDVARVILGHSSPVVTEVYAELDREKAIAVVGRVG